MRGATTLLILLAATAARCAAPPSPDETAAQSAQQTDAVEVFACDFRQSTWDLNYDGWPDNWRRQLGAGLPHYVPVKIADDNGEQALVVSLNGGGAHVESPWFAVSDKFSYKCETRVRIDDVLYAQARMKVELCDADKRVLQTAQTDWLQKTRGWSKLEIGPLNPTDARIQLARIVFEVEPGSRTDLQGRVTFDDVVADRLPKMTVRTNSPFNVYTHEGDVEVTCELSGILNSNPEILFELLDASNTKLDDKSEQLQGELINERVHRASDIVGSASSRRAAYAGKTSWRPPIAKYGFYRIQVTMRNDQRVLKKDVINVALVSPLARPAKGEFGWSLPSADLPVTLDDLAALLPRVAVHWVKMPVWYGENDSARGNALVEFTEQLAAKDVEVVGVLDRPPAGSELAKRLPADAAIADALAIDASTWLPLLDPVLTRLSLRVRWWQLGGDFDASFASLAGAKQEIRKLRDKLFRFGQDVSLGIGWTWNQSAEDTAEPSWEFQQYSSSLPLTGEEIGAYLRESASNKSLRWVLIEPLSRRLYDLDTRARDLVEQMLAAKIDGADAIFAAHPFDDDVGLMTSRGAPSELLLPWRTTASLLGGAKYLGSIQLANGSHNRLFQAEDGSVVMAIWSDAAETREFVNLGDDVRAVDVWGRETKLTGADKQAIVVRPLPLFLRGLNPAITRWCMTTRFESTNVPSIFGAAHPNKISFTNAFSQGVGGTIRISAPKGWQVTPDRIDFKLGAGESVGKQFDVSLPFDANGGPAPIRIDFAVDAERPYRFSVYRELNVGDGEIELETNTRIDRDGALIIEQRLINRGPGLVDFKCFLTVPGRRQQRMQVFRLGPSADVKTYRYPRGAELANKEFLLTVKEISGSATRVFNHKFTAEE